MKNVAKKSTTRSLYGERMRMKKKSLDERSESPSSTCSRSNSPMDGASVVTMGMNGSRGVDAEKSRNNLVPNGSFLNAKRHMSDTSMDSDLDDNPAKVARTQIEAIEKKHEDMLCTAMTGGNSPSVVTNTVESDVSDTVALSSEEDGMVIDNDSESTDHKTMLSIASKMKSSLTGIIKIAAAVADGEGATNCTVIDGADVDSASSKVDLSEDICDIDSNSHSSCPVSPDAQGGKSKTQNPKSNGSDTVESVTDSVAEPVAHSGSKPCSDDDVLLLEDNDDAETHEAIDDSILEEVDKKSVSSVGNPPSNKSDCESVHSPNSEPAGDSLKDSLKDTSSLGVDGCDQQSTKSDVTLDTHNAIENGGNCDEAAEEVDTVASSPGVVSGPTDTVKESCDDGENNVTGVEMDSDCNGKPLVIVSADSELDKENSCPEVLSTVDEEKQETDNKSEKGDESVEKATEESSCDVEMEPTESVEKVTEESSCDVEMEPTESVEKVTEESSCDVQMEPTESVEKVTEESSCDVEMEPTESVEKVTDESTCDVQKEPTKPVANSEEKTTEEVIKSDEHKQLVAEEVSTDEKAVTNEKEKTEISDDVKSTDEKSVTDEKEKPEISDDVKSTDEKSLTDEKEKPEISDDVKSTDEKSVTDEKDKPEISDDVKDTAVVVGEEEEPVVIIGDSEKTDDNVVLVEDSDDDSDLVALDDVSDNGDKVGQRKRPAPDTPDPAVKKSRLDTLIQQLGNQVKPDGDVEDNSDKPKEETSNGVDTTSSGDTGNQTIRIRVKDLEKLILRRMTEYIERTRGSLLVGVQQRVTELTSIAANWQKRAERLEQQLVAAGITTSSSQAAAEGYVRTTRNARHNAAHNKNKVGASNSSTATNTEAAGKGVIDLTDDDEGGRRASQHPASPTTPGSLLRQAMSTSPTPVAMLKPPTTSVHTPASTTNPLRTIAPKPVVRPPPPLQQVRPRQPTSNLRTRNSTVATPPQLVNKIKHPAPFPRMAPNKINTTWKKEPPKAFLNISKVKQGIVLSWNMTVTDQHANIVTYQLFAYQETSATPVPALWKKVGDVKALPLPMACTLTQFQEGNTYHFSVRAMDCHGRLGLFSDPCSIQLISSSTVQSAH